MAEISDLDRIWTRNAWTKSQYHIHWAKENSSQGSGWVLYLNQEAAMIKGVVSRNKMYKILRMQMPILWIATKCYKA